VEDQNYQWIEKLLDTDSKTMGVYLALLYLRVWKENKNFFEITYQREITEEKEFKNFFKITRFKITRKITEEKEFKRLLASYFAGKENVREILDVTRNFVNSVISSLPLANIRNQMLEDVECRFLAKFVKVFRRYIDVAKISEDLREVVPDILLSIRKQIYSSTLTLCGTIEVSTYVLESIIKDHYSLRRKVISPQEINRLISCLENSGLAIKFERYGDLFYLFPAPCFSDEILNSIAKSHQPAEPIDRLNSLRMEVKKLENKVERGVVDDLREAIDEIEFGHLLAGSLIASRVICYIFDKIPCKEESKERVEAKLNELIERGIVEKDRKDEQGDFIWASKKARDIFSHKAGLSPKPEEAHRLLASAVTFAKYYAALTENSSKESMKK
jgi:hypothetical protein